MIGSILLGLLIVLVVALALFGLSAFRLAEQISQEQHHPEGDYDWPAPDDASRKEEP